MHECQIICLANSIKHGGRCIAGVRIDGKGWVRPVSDLPDGTIYPGDYELSNGTDLEVLDLVNIRLTEPRPAKHQPENWLFKKQSWELIARPAPSDALRAVANTLHMKSFLLEDIRDRISIKELDEKPVSSSLTIVQPSELKFYITSSFRGGNQVRAKFALGDRYFDLVVTDPVWKKRLINKSHGTYSLDDLCIDNGIPIFLTLSLGEPYGGHCFKLVAAIFQITLSVTETKRKSSWLTEKRKTHSNAYAKWSDEDDKKLCDEFREGLSNKELAKLFQRNVGAIRSRLIKLRLINQ